MSDELVSPSFIKKLVDAYEELLSARKRPVVRISSDGTLSETTEAVWEFVDDLTKVRTLVASALLGKSVLSNVKAMCSVHFLQEDPLASPNPPRRLQPVAGYLR